MTEDVRSLCQEKPEPFAPEKSALGKLEDMELATAWVEGVLDRPDGGEYKVEGRGNGNVRARSTVITTCFECCWLGGAGPRSGLSSLAACGCAPLHPRSRAQRANTPLGGTVFCPSLQALVKNSKVLAEATKMTPWAEGENYVADLELAAQFLGVCRRTCSGTCPCGTATRGCLSVGKCPTKARGELLYSFRPAHSLICGCLHERVLDRSVLAKGECTTVRKD